MLLPLVSLVIAEAALETVPNEIMHHPSVKKHAQRSGKKPTEILLDRSYHHAAMIQGRLKSEWKRGRPDIIHFALMEALSTPLFFKGILKVYVYTINNKVIFIGENLRIPKSYFRFEGLMMNLFKDKVIKKGQCNNNNNVLLKIYDNVTFESLIKNIVKPDKLIGLSTMGVQHTVEEVVSKNIAKNNNSHCAFVRGGFPKGHFSDNISKLFTCLCSIGKSGLEAHVVIARILYECEKALSLSY
jgi:rRNA small subunit pseudouridine methyltransferase Nep1